MNDKTSNVSSDELKPPTQEPALAEALEKIEALTEEKDALSKQLNAAKDDLVRLKAQNINQINQIEKNSKSREAFAISKFAKEVISIGDVLHTGIENCEDKESEHFKGMEMTLDKLLHVLQEHDITHIEALHQPFNAEQHEAVTVAETDELAPNHVLHVLQEGYMLKNRVLRHAKVIVSKNISEKS